MYEKIMEFAIKRSKAVLVCVTNTLHNPSEAPHRLFQLALNEKVPGKSIFGLKMKPDADMSAGLYGMYMHNELFYDVSKPLSNMVDREYRTKPNSESLHKKLEEMTKHIKQANPNLARRREGDGAEGITGESIYMRELYTVQGSATNDELPAVEAAKGTVMLSYAWGTKMEGTETYPEQARVLVLRDMLHAAGYNVWMDVDWMMGNMDVVMAGAVASCAVFVACLSTAYTTSGNAQKEWQFANMVKTLNRDLVVLQLTTEARDSHLSLKITGDGSGRTTMKQVPWDMVHDLSGLDVNEEIGEQDMTTFMPQFKRFDKALAKIPGLNRRLRSAPPANAVGPVPEASSGGSMAQETERRRFSAASRASSGSASSALDRDPSLDLGEGKKTKRNTFADLRNASYTPPWFVGGVDRNRLCALMEQMSVPGDYVVRESTKHADSFVLVVNEGSDGITENKIARYVCCLQSVPSASQPAVAICFGLRTLAVAQPGVIASTVPMLTLACVEPCATSRSQNKYWIKLAVHENARVFNTLNDVIKGAGTCVMPALRVVDAIKTES